MNKKLTLVCIELLRQTEETPPPDRKCWRLMQMLFLIEKASPMGLPYYWYKEGVVVDPVALTELTDGIIQFRRDEECVGCQIELECPAR